MSPRKQATIKQPAEEPKKPEPVREPESRSTDLIRDLVALIRANLPGREFVTVQKAERYLKEQEADE